MLKKLRRRVVLITLIAAACALLAVLGAVNAANYFSTDRSSSQLLQILSDNAGQFPDSFPAGQTDSQPEEEPPSDSEEAVPHDKGDGAWSPETPYETRFFSVVLEEDGTLVSVNTGRIAAVTSDDAVLMAQTLQQAGKTHGYRGSYKYQASGMDEGVCYVFLDCSRNLTSVRNFLIISSLVYLAGVLAIGLLVLLLSGRMIRPIVESHEKQKQFITNASHELKTPLAVISSCTDVLELDSGENRWTEGIRTQIVRMNTLVAQLIAMSRLEETGTVKRLPTDLSAMTAETLEPFALAAESAGLQWRQELADAVQIEGDAAALRQLVSVLADNAVKYTSSGGTITFRLERRGKKILIGTENPAEGLKKGSQKQLFERFYRGDSSHSSQKPGSGIGLSMACSIAEAHGGRMEAVSPDGTMLQIRAVLPCS